MKVLHLTLKKKWFDMILSGEKREEYRDLSDYWWKRLTKGGYTHIKFVNGYGNHRPWMLVEWLADPIHGCRQMFGVGHPEWGGDISKTVFILKLGKVIDRGNIEGDNK